MSPTLFYWRGGGEVRSDVLAALSAVGYELKVGTSFEEILDLCKRKAPDMIVVDASAGESDASIRVVELSGAQTLFDIPIVFVSYQAEKRSKVLKRQFKRFLPIDIPFTLPRLIEQLQELCPSRPESVPVSTDAGANETAQTTEPSISGPTHQSSKPPVGSRARLLRVEDLPDRKDSAIAHRNKLIQNRDPSQLTSGYGGEAYCQAGALGSIDDELLLPDIPNREVLVRALTEMTDRNNWLGQHARRVAFVSSALVNFLGATTERDMRLRTAAVLLNWGLRDKGEFMPTVDLFFPENKIFASRVAEGFLVSAAFCRNQLQDAETADIISQVASILTPQSNSQTPDLRDIQAVLAVELTDRAIWGNGKWDPFGAHRALRKMSEGTPIAVHRPLKQAVGRLLSEAASSRQFTKNYFPDTETTGDGQDVKASVQTAQQDAKDQFSDRPQMNVQVFDLQPGMLIAHPVISWDGSVVLHSNVVLDDDMIEHLWQLATIRPIRPPLVVAAPNAPVEVEPVSLG